MPVSRGPAGFKDWQRETPWDGGVVYELPLAKRFAAVVGVNVEVTRYASVLARVRTDLKANFLLCEMRWSANSAGTELVGERTIVIPPAGEGPGGFMTFHLPNLGPFVHMNLGPPKPGVPEWESEAKLITDNRQYGFDVPILSPLLIVADSVKLPGGGGSTQFYPRSYYSGPVVITSLISSANGTMVFEVWDTLSEEWKPAYERTITTAAEWSHDTFSVPLGAWRVTMINSAVAEANATIRVLATQSRIG
jgi:hypothetical protein